MLHRLPVRSSSPPRSRRLHGLLGACLVAAVTLGLAAPAAAEWTHWRGPFQTGVSDATGLISDWSREGENLVWRQDFVGRSTPAIVDGRVCVNGRAGEGIDRQEAIACFDAETGEKLWQRNFNVYLTFVPWNRVGWGDPVADAETGNVYLQFVDGRFGAFDADGEIVWMWRLGEDLGRKSGYGGRTNTPVIDEGLVITHVIGSAFGAHVGLGDRWVAFDKRTGEIQWISDKFAPPKDLNTYSSPVIAVIDGRRQVIAGGASGKIVGLDARTGETIWTFHLSQRGLNSSVAVSGSTVVAAHSEENLDTGVMGRVVAFDIAGASGDITKTKEVWRKEEFQAGYVSPAIADDLVYIADNSANLAAIDIETGEPKWEANYGTVGKGSPVIADGKIYLTEVNGHVVVLDQETGEQLSKVHLEVPDGRYAEIYGSIAIAYDRLYFTTEEGVYALGDTDAAFSTDYEAPTDPARTQKSAPDGAAVATLQIVPNAVVGNHDEKVDFRVLGFDAEGRSLGEIDDVTWSIEGIAGEIDADGVAAFDGSKIAGAGGGRVIATKGDLTDTADLRIAGPLPWSVDFESTPEGKPPRGWLGVGKGAKVENREGDGKILVQPKAPRGAPRAYFILGPSSMSGYTVQADAKGNKQGRRFTDVGLVNNGYTMDVQGGHQRIQVVSWGSERRMMQQFPFEWEIGAWYTLKMRVDFEGEGDARKAIIRGKVWKRDEAEPEAWTVTVEDPLPIETGAPGVYTFAPVESYFDNVKVMVND
ncbi:MAG: PQQ-binding-like beta-propeller repeat protein [Acidobacteriota bacterium]